MQERRASDKIKKKNGSVRTKDIYDLLFDRILPMTNDIATIKANTENMKEHCSSVRRRYDERFTVMNDNIKEKITARSFKWWLILTGILLGLIISGATIANIFVGG